MIVKLNYSKGEFTDGKTYDCVVNSIGTEAVRLVHNWISDIGKKLSEILPEDDVDLEVIGDMTFGEMKDKLTALFMSGKAVWTSEEQSLYNIDAKIRESRILTNKVIVDKPTYLPLEYFTGFDCRLTLNGVEHQAWAVCRFGCTELGKADIFVLWNIPEELNPDIEIKTKKKSIFRKETD